MYRLVFDTRALLRGSRSPRVLSVGHHHVRSGRRRPRNARTITCRCSSVRSATRPTEARSIAPRAAMPLTRRRRSNTASLNPRSLKSILAGLQTDQSRRKPRLAWRDAAIGSPCTPSTAARICSRRTRRRGSAPVALSALDEYAPDARNVRAALGLPPDQAGLAETIRSARRRQAHARAGRRLPDRLRGRLRHQARRRRRRPRAVGRRRGRRGHVRRARCRRSSASASSRCRRSCTRAACARSICS